MSRWRTAGVAAVVLLMDGCVAPGKYPEETGASPHVGGGAAVRPDGPLTPDFASQDSADSGGEDPHGEWVDIDIWGNILCALSSKRKIECWEYPLGPSYHGVSFDGEYSDIAVGGQFACASDLSGSVTCEIGYDHIDDFGQFSPPSGALSGIDADAWQSCGLRYDGSLECWGWEWEDQRERTEGTFSSVEVGTYMSCGVTPDGLVRCWGDAPGLDDSWVPGDRRFVSVSVGPRNACAVDSFGVPFCWGGRVPGPLTIPEGMRFLGVAAGSEVSCGVTIDRTLACWIVEAATPETESLIEDVPKGKSWKLVRTSGGLACALDTQGRMACWGPDRYLFWADETDVPTLPDQ